MWWSPEYWDVFIYKNEEHVNDGDRWDSQDIVILKRAHNGLNFIPLISVGQCIELLQKYDRCVTIKALVTHVNGNDVFGWEVELRHLNIWKNSKDLIDALWEAVKSIL
jgi:hypothetical protein